MESTSDPTGDSTKKPTVMLLIGRSRALDGDGRMLDRDGGVWEDDTDSETQCGAAAEEMPFLLYQYGPGGDKHTLSSKHRHP